MLALLITEKKKKNPLHPNYLVPATGSFCTEMQRLSIRSGFYFANLVNDIA